MASKSTYAELQKRIRELEPIEAERDLLRSAVEQAGEIIVITDTQGIIQYVNPAFEKITGYTREEAIGQNPRILNSGKQDTVFYERLWRTILSGRVWEGRLINKRKDGSLFTEDATISPISDAQGRIVNFVAVKHDISEHLRLADQLMHAQKMDAIGQLAGGVAHDYNNMLSVILGHAELALDKVISTDPARENLIEIVDAAKRSTEVTRQLLAFARKQPIAPQILDMNDTIQAMLKMLRRLIGEDIDLELKPGRELWPVRVDPIQFDQILANLCVNSRDAISGPGKILIETGTVTLDPDYCSYNPGFVPGDFVLLAVSDTGCGMEKEVLNRLFEPFFTTKPPGRGTGLGLAMVYGIVKQNNGFIHVYSEPNAGTCFKIYLPRQVGVIDTRRAENANEMPLGGGETVLLVEDELSIMNMVRLMLEKLGYQVLSAATPQKALDLAAECNGHIELLVTDVVMPQMNGHELAARLITRYPSIKTLFISGYTADAIAHRGMLNEGIHFMPKPFSKRELAAKVRDALEDKPRDQHPPLSESSPFS
jgi:PAS domain S-box-containing protein